MKGVGQPFHPWDRYSTAFGVVSPFLKPNMNHFQTSSAPYPVDAFHLMACRTIREVQSKVQAPDALIAISTLATMAVACQGLIDVRLPSGQVRPVSLNLLCLAESGDRKTSVDNLISAPMHALDEARAGRYESDLAQYRVDKRVWAATTKGLDRAIARALTKNQPVEGLKEQLLSHLKAEPSKPRQRRFMRQSLTDRAFMEAIEGDGESIMLATDEGEIVLKGGAMGQLGLKNSAWDGARVLAFDRAGDTHVVVRNPRVTLSVMVQPRVLMAYIERHGEIARGSGFWARNLVASPTSTQGFRFVNFIDNTWHELPKFHQRIAALLAEYDEKISAGHFTRDVLDFSDEAIERWIQMVNITEGMLQPWGYLNDIKDFASKAMEIAGRVAAILHHINQEEGKISVDTLNRALHIVEWHLYEFKRLFSPQFRAPQDEIDALALENYLHTHYFSRGVQTAPRNAVLHSGPVRPVSRFQEALSRLERLGKVWIGIQGRKRYINRQQNYTLI